MRGPRNINNSIGKRQTGALIFIAGNERRRRATVPGAGIGGGNGDGAGELLVAGQQIDCVKALVKGRS